MKALEIKGEAVVDYKSSDYRVIKPGCYVICSVSGAHIPLDHLQYWNAEKQEAYASYVEAAIASGITLYSTENN